MALIKPFETPYGDTFEYWKILSVITYTKQMKMSVALYPYKNKQMRMEDKEPYSAGSKTIEFSFTYEDLESSPNLMALIYNKCKTIPEHSESEEEEVPFFADAIDDL